VDEWPDPEDLHERYVRPFYLKMMRLNAVRAPEGMLSEIRNRSQELSPKDVKRLLLAPWRPRVMGTWYAIAAPHDEYEETICTSLRSSKGSLTAPALLAAVVLYAPAEGLEVIAEYARVDLAARWGAAADALAAASMLASERGVSNPLPAATAEDLETFGTLMAVARRLHEQAA